MITFPIVIAYLIWTATVSAVLPPYVYEGTQQEQHQ
jgi:hypothetical protein